jgi:CRP-like cAMP-binding protein
MEQKKFLAGELIVADGSTGAEVYVVRSGKVRVFKTQNGEKIELGFINQNDMFGEMSIFLKSRRTASVEAAVDSEIIILDKENVFDMIKQDSAFAVQMITRLSSRLIDAHKVIGKLEGEIKSLKIMGT